MDVDRLDGKVTTAFFVHGSLRPDSPAQCTSRSTIGPSFLTPIVTSTGGPSIGGSRPSAKICTTLGIFA